MSPSHELHKALYGRIRLRPRRGGDQPKDQQQCADAQGDAGDAVADRQDRGELWPVDLEIRRERSIVVCHQAQLLRWTIIFLIAAIALPGFSCFGQVRVQLRMVWQR